MAGSYHHCVDDRGYLLDAARLGDMLDAAGDVWEAAAEMYGMIWFLAKGDPSIVEAAQRNYRMGIRLAEEAIFGALH